MSDEIALALIKLHENTSPDHQDKAATLIQRYEMYGPDRFYAGPKLRSWASKSIRLSKTINRQDFPAALIRYFALPATEEELAGRYMPSLYDVRDEPVQVAPALLTPAPAGDASDLNSAEELIRRIAREEIQLMFRKMFSGTL